jgi:hypothetical protein
MSENFALRVLTDNTGPPPNMTYPNLHVVLQWVVAAREKERLCLERGRARPTVAEIGYAAYAVQPTRCQRLYIRVIKPLHLPLIPSSSPLLPPLGGAGWRYIC